MKVTFKVDKIRLNHAGFRKLRTSVEAEKAVGQIADRIAAAAGDGFVVDDAPSRTRARKTVHPDTYEAQRDDLENLTLIRSIGAGRG